jgi:hypothetical protein
MQKSQTMMTIPDCPKCGCNEIVVVATRNLSLWSGNRARCEHCKSEFSFDSSGGVGGITSPRQAEVEHRSRMRKMLLGLFGKPNAYKRF